MNLTNRSNIKYLLIIIFLLLVIVSLNGSMGEDEGRFSYMGRIWANNDMPPYSDSIENKTPGIFILNAISFSLFGTNIFFLRLLGILTVTFSSLIVYKITNIISNNEAGMISMLVFGITMSWRNLEGMFSSYTETFMILFILISFYILVSRIIKNRAFKYLIVGSSMGLAIAFKQIAVTSAFFIFLFILFFEWKENNNKYRIYNLFLYTFGVIMGTIISIVPLLISGVSIMEYINGAWLLLLDDGSTPDFTKRFVMARELWLNSRIVLYYPILLFVVLLPDLFKNKYFILLIIWLLLDFIGVNASGYYFGHQLRQIMPSLSIIIGIILTKLIFYDSKLTQSTIKKYSIFVVVLIITILPYQSIVDNIITFRDSNYVEKYREIGYYIKNNTNEDEYIYTMTNANAILSYSDRISASKYFNPLFMNTIDEYDYVLNELRSKSPVIIIQRINETQFIFPESFHQFVDQNYFMQKELYGFKIFKNKLSND